MPSERSEVEQAALEAQFEAAPPPPPKTGVVPLTSVDCEAVKGLSAAQRELNARWRAVELEILSEAPAGARVTKWDVDQGVAAWEVKP